MSGRRLVSLGIVAVLHVAIVAALLTLSHEKIVVPHMATSEELIAHNRSVEQVRSFLEVDSLAYLSLEGMVSCMSRNTSDYCTACWSGKYKIPIDQPQSKFSFERDQLKMF